MKHKFLCFSASKWFVFLLEAPLVFLFVLAILNHNSAASVFKLFPLEIVLGALILFLPIYFLRLVLLMRDECRTVGVFSSRERSVIRKDKTLVLTLLKHGFFRIELFGRDSDEPALEWLQNDKNYQPEDYCMLRARAVGRKNAIKKILVFYGISIKGAEQLLSEAGKSEVTEDIQASSYEREQGFTVSIRFLTTIL